MATYLAKFIPNFSQLASPLRVLLEKNTACHWDKPQQDSFEKLKVIITNAPVLKYYDVTKDPDVTIQVDASPNGLGAVLLQDEHPVAYASRSLTQSEQNYAQIKKEMLAITFGCERFHEYIYLRKEVSNCEYRSQTIRIYITETTVSGTPKVAKNDSQNTEILCCSKVQAWKRVAGGRYLIKSLSTEPVKHSS